MTITLIANPSDADTTAALREQVARLRRTGSEVRPRLTFENGDASRFAREAAEQGDSLVIAAGGDGTVNEVVNGLHAFHTAEGNAERKLPWLAIVPLGTGNDLATSLGIPAEIPSAFEVAVRGTVKEVDVGLVDGRCFVNASTGGLGAEATEETPTGVKRTLGIFAYAITGAKKLVALHGSEARFTTDEVIYDGRFLLFAVGNSRQTGGGNLLTPKADLSDGLLDLCIVREISRMELLPLLPELRAGNHLEHPAVLYRQVRSLRVESAEELSVNADGEPLSGSSFHYSLAPYRIPLVVPSE